MKLVLDASMALAWLFARQNPTEVKCADKVLMTLEKAETIVPSLWHLEITNALLVGERRQVITEAQALDYLNRLSKLPIATDNTQLANRRELIAVLAREHSLTAYDATYLDLALREGAIIATFDTKLAKAMQKTGGRVFE